MRILTRFISASLPLLVALPLAAQAPAAAPAGAAPPNAKPDHLTAIKTSLKTSMAALRHYQWVETTVVSMKGEVKATTQNQCYYGADGALQKTPVGPPPEEKKSRGLRGKIAADKKEELSATVKEAVALVKQYVPPNPEKIQAAKTAGNLSVSPPDPAGNVQIAIKNYLKSGDLLTISANAGTDTITGMSVSTFADNAKDVVALKVNFAAFPDGTIYPAKIVLDIKSEELNIGIDNSGYKKM